MPQALIIAFLHVQDLHAGDGGGSSGAGITSRETENSMSNTSDQPSLLNSADRLVQEFDDVIAQFADYDLRGVLAGNSSNLGGKIIAFQNASSSYAWKIFTLVHLLNAAAHLLFGPFDRIAVDIGESGTAQPEPSPLPERLPSLLDILRTARDRNFVRKAICGFRAGGPEGLFDAYEALTYELMERGASEYARDRGTREWLDESGWASKQEIDSLIETVLYERWPTPDEPRQSPAISPPEAEALVRRLLLKLVDYCVNGKTVAPS
jgi:hypothetical protein